MTPIHNLFILNILSTHLEMYVFPLLHLYTVIIYDPTMLCQQEDNGFPFEPFFLFIFELSCSSPQSPIACSLGIYIRIPVKLLQ